MLFAAAPLFLSSYDLSLTGRFLALSLTAMGLVLLWGEGGILSLGQGVFFGLGGYAIAMQHFVHFVRADKQVRTTVVALHESEFCGAFLGVKGADDRLQNIEARHHALKGAVLVMHEAHMHRGVAQDRDDIARVDGFGDDRGFADQLANIRCLP